MSIDLSKLCADYLRTSYSSQTSGKLKASHARELVAAFFGYKSHATLIAEKTYPLDKLEEAAILVPDIPLIEQRRSRLSDLPNDVPLSLELAKMLSAYLQDEGHFNGNVWLYDSLESYVVEVLIHDCDSMLSDELSGVMAETNASFFMPYFDEAEIEDSGDDLIVIATGKYEGEPLDDKPFCGDTIDATVHITLPRIAGKRGFLDFDFTAGGSVNDDWVDPELRFGVSAQSSLAGELGISDSELELLEWEIQEVASDDGLIYGYVLTFYENSPSEILEKIDGLSDDLTIRVSANAFDEAPEPMEEEAESPF